MNSDDADRQQMDDAGEVTHLLERLQQSPESLEQLIALVYDDMRRVAHFQRGNASGGAPQTTILVHEAFLKVFGKDTPAVQNRKHLLRLTALTVRQLIVDHARARLSQKRGQGAVHVELSDHSASVSREEAERVLVIEEAIDRLQEHDAKLAELVVGSYFAGYSAAELAELSDCSSRTINRELKRARAWLRLEMHAS
ncbi:sigma-70 family RNA polymerase sigma factor [Wenzhouxiangella sp. AB-CW3]|uniref:ECF-type sigma factor n=1 Tax=Wenzhouxiangella sp. AB-CW3 TaxID=2771012 RepID=UPI00168BF915|nr:ECF-type sigma factor [Wenzhouxiangella sp. AB-CW3]QOC21363.1 sigma-70 family RNA polymerase sigma factor [Wenzhouxiangella sp. AB-CW3]